jgi:ABC-2 type transport system permease protein
MRKIGLVIRREYLTRVRNKTFILSTILLPLFFIAMIAGSAYFTVKSKESYSIAVNDNNGIFKKSFKNDNTLSFSFPEGIDQKNFNEKGYDVLLNIPKDFDSPKDSISLISTKQVNIQAEESIRDQINSAIRTRAFLERNIDKKILDSINALDAEKMYKFSPVVKTGDEIKESNSGLSYGIGFGSGILIYITLFIYGAAVMRGVMEEKMSRIAEVVISSVRPFQLMMGKIIGIAAVGITQLLIWLILIIAFSSIATSFISHDALQHSSEAVAATQNGGVGMSMKLLNAKTSFLNANWAVIIPCFLFYFLGGYLFYAALFAAVGSVVNEDPQEAQSLMLPITMPIVFSFIIMSTAAGQPNSSIAVWGSMIPFSSPIVMMARIPSGSVPAWQIAVSMLSLVAGFILTTMLAAKIYRTGILLYGKKVTFKEMGKWLMRKA